MYVFICQVLMARNPELLKFAAIRQPESVHDESNPKVYFDITIGGIKAGRIVFEVR